MSQWYPAQRGCSTHPKHWRWWTRGRVITEVETIDIHGQAIESPMQCACLPKQYIFKKEWLGKKIITHVTFYLISKKPPATVTYKDLVSYFEMSSQEIKICYPVGSASLEVLSQQKYVTQLGYGPTGKVPGRFLRILF